MVTIVIANIIDFCGAMIQIYSGTLKEKKRILIAQTVQLLVQTVSMLLLGGITGAISNLLSCLRNILGYREKLNWLWKIVLIGASLAMTIAFNTQGALGWLPFAVCTIFILLMDMRSPIGFKILVTASFVPWVIYYLVIRSYTGAFFAAATIVTNIISLAKMVKKK